MDNAQLHSALGDVLDMITGRSLGKGLGLDDDAIFVD